jgi:hypothetical protein
MLIRFFTSVAAGLVVGGILYEGALTAYGLFFPGSHLLEALHEGPALSVGQALVLVVFWALGASASALLAAGMAGNRWAGLLAASCWIIPIYLLMKLGEQPPAYLSLAFSITALAGAISVRLIDTSTAERPT